MAQMGLMVPVSELHAAKAESSKLRETIDGLSQLLRSTQAEAEKQSSAVQVLPSARLNRIEKSSSVRFFRF